MNDWDYILGRPIYEQIYDWANKRLLDDLGRMHGLDAVIENHFTDLANYAMRQIFEPPLTDLYSQMTTSSLDSVVHDSIGDVARAAYGLSSSIENLYKSLLQAPETGAGISTWKVGSFIDPLPDLGPIEEWLREQAATQGEEALEDSKFGFSTILFEHRFLASLAGITQQVRRAIVTKKVLAMTRRPEFERDFFAHFERSTTLRRRREILKSAFSVHLNREYLVSIPVLIAQVEGLFGDALLLKGTVISKGRKLYVMGSDGKPTRGKNNKEIEVKGIDRLLEIAEKQDDRPLMAGVAWTMADSLFPDYRNGILHGRTTNYRLPWLSAQAILALRVMAQDIAAFEAGEIDTEFAS